jgi:hypothetical protein
MALLVDVMLSERRDLAAAKAFFRSAKAATGTVPDRVTSDGHDAYPRAIRTALGKTVTHRTSRYLMDIFDKPFSRAVLIFVSHGRPRGEERVLGMRAQPRALTTSVSRLRRPCTVRAWSANW